MKYNHKVEYPTQATVRLLEDYLKVLNDYESLDKDRITVLVMEKMRLFLHQPKWVHLSGCGSRSQSGKLLPRTLMHVLKQQRLTTEKRSLRLKKVNLSLSLNLVTQRKTKRQLSLQSSAYLSAGPVVTGNRKCKQDPKQPTEAGKEARKAFSRSRSAWKDMSSKQRTAAVKGLTAVTVECLSTIKFSKKSGAKKKESKSKDKKK